MTEQIPSRLVYFISDGTGITAESFGQSLLAQFEHIRFDRFTLPYIDTEEKARKVVNEITTAAAAEQEKPLIFSTVIAENIAAIIREAPAERIDIFDAFMPTLERKLHSHAVHQIGKKRSINAIESKYNQRIDAVHFAIENDDGAKVRFYDQADIIIVGVSRCGKTPTCLYMGLQFGIFAANYPITEDDLDMMRLPKVLQPHKHKLFGLTISPERLAAIRHERRPNSRYSSPRQCALELNEVEQMFTQHNIPFLNSTHYSVEEIATRIIAQAGIERRLK